jgi:hypothetical protein
VKVILTDIDDTVLQFGPAFEKWAVDQKGYTLQTTIRDGGSIEASLGCHRDDVDSLVIEFSTNPTYFGAIPPEVDALAVIPVLHRMGYQFAAISSCVDGPEVTECRRRNLEEAFGFKWLDVHCVGLLAPKEPTLRQYDPSWWVEDNAKNAYLGDQIGHKSFLLDRPYNRVNFDTPNAVSFVNSWHDVFEAIVRSERDAV